MTKDEAMKLALEALERAKQTAMLFSLKARVPECGEFAGIAQDLDWAVETLRQALEQPSDIEAAVRAENEACAKVCEAIYNDPNGNNGEDAYYTRPYLECAAAIRERMK